MAGRRRHDPRQERLLDERGDLQLVVQAPVLLGEQPVALAGVADAAHEQLGDQVVLDEVVLRAALDRLDRDLVVVEVAEDDHRRGLVEVPDDREALPAARRVGREPQQHRVVGAGVCLRHLVRGGRHHLDGERGTPRLLQESAHPLGAGGIVLDEQHPNDARGDLSGHALSTRRLDAGGCAVDGHTPGRVGVGGGASGRRRTAGDGFRATRSSAPHPTPTRTCRTPSRAWSSPSGP